MQELLPLIPAGATQISQILSVVSENGRWTYFHGVLPVYSHIEGDKSSFRMITSSFICEGVCANSEIQAAFNVSKRSVIRSSKKFKKHGCKAFFPSQKKASTKSRVFTPEIIAQAEELLSSENATKAETAKKLGVKYDTLKKAIKRGAVVYTQKPYFSGTDKSERSLNDCKNSEILGMGCNRIEERVLSAFGFMNMGECRFEHCRSVTFGGVLISLAALEANGLYYMTEECFSEFKGYYSVIQILTLLAIMALCRIKSVEKLRWHSPGELGKLLGLDRIPEVRCLRNKLDVLSSDGSAERWGELLSRKWMNVHPELSGVLYVDGHVRLYAGKEQLPKLYVSRERLCLRGVMDFWVNDMLGQPFFVVRNSINPGMLEVLRTQIVPRLINEVPNQPSEEMFASNPYIHRFIIVFDREGYSPEFFKEMWEKYRIACITYRKYQKEDWNVSEFKEIKVNLVNTEETSMLLAERGSFIGDAKSGCWVKEVRKLTQSGHQTAIVSTAYLMENMVIAPLMFARWCQENYFNYMMQHYALDLLSEYKKVGIPDTEKVISPNYRRLEKEINSTNGKMKNLKSRFADFTLHPATETDSKKYRQWEKSKVEMTEEIVLLESKLSALKAEQKTISKHIKIVDMPEDSRFNALATSKKQLTDTVKMIAYRAETSMASIIAKEAGAFEQARALLRDVFISDADLIPDAENKTLTVRLHNLSTKGLDKVLDQLLKTLNETETKYPGTNLVLRYERIGAS